MWHHVISTSANFVNFKPASSLCLQLICLLAKKKKTWSQRFDQKLPDSYHYYKHFHIHPTLCTPPTWQTGPTVASETP